MRAPVKKIAVPVFRWSSSANVSSSGREAPRLRVGRGILQERGGGQGTVPLRHAVLLGESPRGAGAAGRIGDARTPRCALFRLGRERERGRGERLVALDDLRLDAPSRELPREHPGPGVREAREERQRNDADQQVRDEEARADAPEEAAQEVPNRAHREHRPRAHREEDAERPEPPERVHGVAEREADDRSERREPADLERPRRRHSGGESRATPPGSPRGGARPRSTGNGA